MKVCTENKISDGSAGLSNLKFLSSLFPPVNVSKTGHYFLKDYRLDDCQN